MTTPDPAPAGKFDWQRLILSLGIPTTTKAVALALSIYASKDGRNAHPGLSRLGWALCADEKTIRRHLGALRKLQLIERTFHGSSAGRGGRADTYRLVIPWDLAARVRIRDYDQEHRTPESTDNDDEHRTPESTDNGESSHGTVDSESGTVDFESRTVDSRAHPPGSTTTFKPRHHSPIRSAPRSLPHAGAHTRETRRRDCPSCGKQSVSVMPGGKLRPHGPRDRWGGFACTGIEAPC